MILSIFININYKKFLCMYTIFAFFTPIQSNNWITDWIDSQAKKVYQDALKPFYRGKTRVELKNIKEVYEYSRTSTYRSLIIGSGFLFVSLCMLYELKDLFSSYKKRKEKNKLMQETTWKEDEAGTQIIGNIMIIPFSILAGCAFLTQAAIANKVQEFAWQDLRK